jgi:hypothetical protein
MIKLRRGFGWNEDLLRIEEKSMIPIIEGQRGDGELTEGPARTAENRVSMAYES